MKIFNWMHRRFIPKDGLGQNYVKKDEEILIKSNYDHADTAAQMLGQFHGWDGAGAGILSIGTFGLQDAFGINDHQHTKLEYLEFMAGDDELVTESEDDEYSDDQSHDDDDESEDDNSFGGEQDYEQEWNPLLYDKSGAPWPTDAAINGLQVEYFSDEHDNNNYNISISISNNINKKERITLADLFSADDDHDHGFGTNKKPNNYCKTRPQSKCFKKPTPHHAMDKNGTLLFPKKLIPRVKEDSRPIQKFHGLMKRMLKRKVHPDAVEGKIKPCAAANVIPSADDHFGINESVSLLQSQDATGLL
ncbi:hypothetical protein ACH5RR_024225 [Cinchona calisaya]|uniref:Protein TILLER ANGLE CONTROL 1 n=1 Tax=Cinchona calisaya TaxID=153742 RepID=A0ABD2ZHY1_9GENT